MPEMDLEPDTERSPVSPRSSKRQQLVHVLELAATACGSQLVRDLRRLPVNCTVGESSALERSILRQLIALIAVNEED